MGERKVGGLTATNEQIRGQKQPKRKHSSQARKTRKNNQNGAIISHTVPQESTTNRNPTERQAAHNSEDSVRNTDAVLGDDEEGQVPEYHENEAGEGANQEDEWDGVHR
eukprot:CAMPEP_0174273770 /NCGR_PEP_ID=MMETSP0439-20130205/55712_1 /TAXON_ID=0 /ORGANISM="Stereomyxa ramosa, Strain Chinc5" /LENGTH=108 /DNA_ID=CAMNT_0015365151 /DNA_START=123 /DNA_END=449 /DNA_ORIENTATION=-